MTLLLIAKIAGIILVLSGFAHFLIGNKVSQGKKWRLTYLKWTRTTIVGLTIVIFGITVTYLIIHLIGVIKL